MTLVIDASVAAHWTLLTSLSPQAKRLLASKIPLIAPDFIIAEITNAFYLHARQYADRLTRMEDGLEFLPRWFAELVPTAPLRTRAFTIARELIHPAYDCFYVALAENRGTRLVTADAHLVRKVAPTPWSNHVVHIDDWHSP